MPVRLQGIVEAEKENEILANLLEMMNVAPDHVGLAPDGQHIMVAYDFHDRFSGKLVLREVITLLHKTEMNRIEIQDVDLVLLDSPVKTMTELYRGRHLYPTWETYQAVAGGRHLNVETVNRALIPEAELSEITAALSVFPFDFKIYPDEDSLNADFGEFKLPDLVPEWAGKTAVLGSDFVGAFSSPLENGEEDTYTLFTAQIDGYEKSTVLINKKQLDFFILTFSVSGLEGMQAILPFNREVERNLQDGRYIYMAASVKADVALGEYYYYGEKEQQIQTVEEEHKQPTEPAEEPKEQTEPLQFNPKAFVNNLTNEDGTINADFVSDVEKMLAEQAEKYYETKDKIYFLYRFKDIDTGILYKVLKQQDNTLNVVDTQWVQFANEPMKRTLLAVHGNMCMLTGESGLIIAHMDPMDVQEGEELYIHPYIYAERVELYENEEEFDNKQQKAPEEYGFGLDTISSGMVLPLVSMASANAKKLGISKEDLKDMDYTFSVAAGKLVGYGHEEQIAEIKDNNAPVKSFCVGFFHNLEFVTYYGHMTTIIEHELLLECFERMGRKDDMDLHADMIIKVYGTVGAVVDKKVKTG